MSWYRLKRVGACLLLLGALLLFPAGCGFRPLYGQGGAEIPSVHYAEIDIANIPDRDGQYLRNLLIDRLWPRGKMPEARYLLRITPPRVKTTSIGIRKDASSTRGQMEITADLTLTETATGKVLLKRAMRGLGSYNRLDDQFATIVSEQYSRERILEELGDSIVTEIALYFERQKAKAALP